MFENLFGALLESDVFDLLELLELVNLDLG